MARLYLAYPLFVGFHESLHVNRWGHRRDVVWMEEAALEDMLPRPAPNNLTIDIPEKQSFK